MGKFARIVAVLAFGLPVAARADVITQTNTIEEVMFPGGFGGIFTQFNPSLGTLQGVSVGISGDVSFFVTYTSDPASCSPYACFASVTFSLGFSFNAPGFLYMDPYVGPYFASPFYYDPKVTSLM